ncbi:CshA/CshB family fibrillar adhesin-related protein [Oscillospiraceae bacterium PP1C4]
MSTTNKAAAGSPGNFANIIEWIDFGPLDLAPGGPSVHVVNTIPSGYTIEFDIQNIYVSGVMTNIQAEPSPLSINFAFGNTGYIGIAGRPIIRMDTAGSGYNTTSAVIKNITVKRLSGSVVTSYDLILADAETVGMLATIPQRPEIMKFTTDGIEWNQIDNLPPVILTPNFTPAISGVGSLVVTETGIGPLNASSTGPVFSTTRGKNIQVDMTTAAQVAFAFGIIITERSQAITDIIESVALEQTALSHIMNAEGEKIQKIVAMSATPQQLLNANKSVSGMLNTISVLENILQGKLGLFEECICNGSSCTITTP